MAARPYRLGFTTDGLTFDQWGAYATPEAAWKKKDKHWVEITEKRHQHHYGGWWVVTYPDGSYVYEAAGMDGSHNGKQGTAPTFSQYTRCTPREGTGQVLKAPVGSDSC